MVSNKKESQQDLPEQTFELKLHQKVVYGKLQIELTGITEEIIAADPIDKESSPSGSGVSFSFRVSDASGKSEDISLDEVSEPYDSHKQVNWNGYNITLVDITHEGGVTLPRIQVVKLGSSPITQGETFKITFGKENVPFTQEQKVVHKSYLEFIKNMHSYPEKEIDEFSYTSLNQTLLPDFKLFYATGWAEGGHIDLPKLILAIYQNKPTVLRIFTKTENIDKDGYAQKFSQVLACPVQALDLDDKNPDSFLKVGQIEKNECLDFTPELFSGIKKDAQKPELTDWVSLLAVLANDTPDVKIISSINELATPLNKLTESEAQYSPVKKITDRKIQISPVQIKRYTPFMSKSNNVSASGFLEVGGDHLYHFKFDFNDSDQKFQYQQELLGFAIQYRE